MNFTPDDIKKLKGGAGYVPQKLGFDKRRPFNLGLGDQNTSDSPFKMTEAYWYKINGKTCTKAAYLAYENKPGSDEPGKSTNDPDASGNKAKTDDARKNNEASKKHTVLTKKQTEVKDQGTKPPKKTIPLKMKSPLKWGWKDTLDAAQTGLTAAGMVPLIGNVADAVNTGVSGARMGYAKYKGDKKGVKEHGINMGINAASMIPGAGLAVGGAKLVNTAVKGTKLAQKGANLVKNAKKAEKVMTTAYKGNKAGKVTNTTKKLTNAADAITSRAVVGKGKKGAYNAVSGKVAVKGSKVVEGTGDSVKTLASNNNTKTKTKKINLTSKPKPTNNAVKTKKKFNFAKSNNYSGGVGKTSA